MAKNLEKKAEAVDAPSVEPSNANLEPVAEPQAPIPPTPEDQSVQEPPAGSDASLNAPGDIPEVEPGAEFKPTGRGQGQAGKRRGPYKRADGQAGPQASTPSAPKPEPPNGKAFDPNAARAMGERMAQMVIGLVGISSPDFMPQTDVEKALAQGAIKQTGQFCVDSELTDLPPGVALAVAWISFYASMAASERNRPKVQSLWTKARMWYAARKAAKAAK
jgi:hypothetical protein